MHTKATWEGKRRQNCPIWQSKWTVHVVEEVAKEPYGTSSSRHILKYRVRVRVELLVLRKCVDPDENARRVEVHENLCFHSQFGSTSVPLDFPATAGGLLELRGCSSTYIPTSDIYIKKRTLKLNVPVHT